jgi:hypothetical protein
VKPGVAGGSYHCANVRALTKGPVEGDRRSRTSPCDASPKAAVAALAPGAGDFAERDDAEHGHPLRGRSRKGPHERAPSTPRRNAAPTAFVAPRPRQRPGCSRSWALKERPVEWIGVRARVSLWISFATSPTARPRRALRTIAGSPICSAIRRTRSHGVGSRRRGAASRGMQHPGCPYVHRMAVLVPGFELRRAEGDLFLIPDAAIAVIDRLESGSASLQDPYVRERVTVVSLDGEDSYAAEAYVARGLHAGERSCTSVKPRRSRPTRVTSPQAKRRKTAASALRGTLRRTTSSIRSNASLRADRASAHPACDASAAHRLKRSRGSGFPSLCATMGALAAADADVVHRCGEVLGELGVGQPRAGVEVLGGH